MARSVYPVGCDGNLAFGDPVFQCPIGYETVQKPPPPPPGTVVGLTLPASLSISYYWKFLLSLPTICGGVNTIKSSQQVEHTKSVSSSLQSEMGSLTLASEVKTTNTLGFDMGPYGEKDYIYHVDLYQLVAYIKWYQHVTPGVLGFLEFAIAWLTGWMDTGDCVDQHVPLNKFDVLVCRQYCGRGSP